MRVIVPILLAFVAIAVLCAHTNLPWSDEAWFASPALNLITNGSFGTSVLDPTASFRTNNLTGIRQHTYWIVPLFPLAEAAWFRAMGFGLMQVRYLSILWGLVALWAWYRMLRILSGDERVARTGVGIDGGGFHGCVDCLRGPHGYDVRGVGRRRADGLSDLARTQLYAGGAGEPELDCGGRVDPSDGRGLLPAAWRR